MRSRSAVTVMLALVVFVLAAPGVRADAAGARKKLDKEDVPFTPEKFFSSVSRGDVKKVSLFLEAGMPVDTRDKYGGTALLGATKHSDPKLLLLLLKARPHLGL